jgi:hypothetical protein
MKESAEIIEKIQRLLALANSDNEHEAKLAAERATALLTKHNLSMQDIAVEEREYESIHFMGVSSRMQMEQKYLLTFSCLIFSLKLLLASASIRTWVKLFAYGVFLDKSIMSKWLVTSTPSST